MNCQEENIVAGADIGGSHITVALVNLKDKFLVKESTIRKDINSKGSESQILDGWLSAVKEAIAWHDGRVNKLSFAMPGPFDYKRGISLIKGLDKFESIYGCNIKQYFADVLDMKPENILFRNDAEAFLHGEVFCGAARNLDKVIGLTLGTGFGSAISQNGITTDLNLGSEPFLKSIADEYFTTRWFIKRFKELTGRDVCGVKEISGCIEETKTCSIIFNEFSTNLASFLTPYLSEKQVFDIVLGGNISKAHHLFLANLKRYIKDNNLLVDIKLAELSEDAALIGAAASFDILVNSKVY
ncbi:ROK family member transcriptional repressor [Arcticibacter svalbardensis MN12-7]|uniref:ROK family member transcriptional repressor n=1 Tax=Arcticibacter svalbardensis MN12-7 TaxID=1150600 RepID=R9GPB9_9SPHI|nr:ROK family protein [Arcticibacter svalbardensis]EOR93561.1 ROK family member transcriptional repressor [Arcticibacter svalbardensis MN12-7]